MKNYKLLCFLAVFMLLIPQRALAYQHGYARKTDEIYAIARQDLSIYADEYDYDIATYLPRFSGIRVIFRGESWYEIEYDTKHDGTQMGWITKEDFYANCLIYDGREKQALANGDYQLTYIQQESLSIWDFFSLNLHPQEDVLDLHFTFLGDGLYSISKKGTDEYMQPDSLFDQDTSDFWGQEKTAGAFYITRDGDYFTIQDSVSYRYLVRQSTGILCFDKDDTYSKCQLVRFDKATTDDSMRNFAQFDAEWCDYYYGPGKNEEPGSNLFCTSGCGIFAAVNAIYASTGMYPDPYAMADYAVEKEYRILGCGTDSQIFKGLAKKYGDTYGFTYDGSTGDIETMIKKLKAGDVCIAHIPGHYAAIVDYDQKKKKFLLMDSHYLSKRGTNAYGDWISRKALDGEIQEGNLEGSEYYFYKANRPQ